MKVGHFSNLGLSLLCLSEHCWAVVNELFLSLTDNRRNYFRKFYAHFSLVIYYYIVPFSLKTGANTVGISPRRLPGGVPEETVFAFVLFSAYFYTIFLWTSRKTLSPDTSEAGAALWAIHPKGEQLRDCHQEDKKKARSMHDASEWHFVVSYEKRRHPGTHDHFHAISAGRSTTPAEPYQLRAWAAQRTAGGCSPPLCGASTFGKALCPLCFVAGACLLLLPVTIQSLCGGLRSVQRFLECFNISVFIRILFVCGLLLIFHDWSWDASPQHYSLVWRSLNCLSQFG